MVQVADNSIIYLGNGINTTFPYYFQIIDPTDIQVILVNPEGVETTITSDYYVDTTQHAVFYPGYPPGAEEPVSETPPILPEGWKLILYRQVPIDQQSIMDSHWPFKEIERMVDKSRIIDQQLAGDLARALKVSLQYPNMNIVIPVAPNKSFKWNDTGTGLELFDVPNVQIVIDNISTVLAAPEYALTAKRYAIGVPSEPAEGSAKYWAGRSEYWAGQSHADQRQSDWDETDITKVTYIKNKLVPVNTITSGAIPGNKDIISAKFIVDHLEEFTFVLDDDTEIKKKFLVVDYTAPADTGD